MPLIFIVLLTWPMISIAQDCNAELDALKKSVEEKAVQCEAESSEAMRRADYERELEDLESDYKSRFLNLSLQKQASVEKLKSKYGVK